MAVTKVSKGRDLTVYLGLSTDQKPTKDVQPFQKFLEVDTGYNWVFDGETWYLNDITQTHNFVWNTDGMDWEAMEQPTVEYGGDLTVTMGDVERLLAENYWLNFKYDYNATGDCIYKGMNTSLSATNGYADWYIVKFDYTSGDCTQKRVKTTSWTLRTVGW